MSKDAAATEHDMTMQTHMMRFRDVLDRIQFGEWRFLVEQRAEGAVLVIQVDEGICNVTGAAMSWRSRKWPLSIHMTDGEIVQTAFKAVMTAMEHEVREMFRYRGESIFDPHYDVEKLVELRRRPDALKERATPVTAAAGG